MAGSETTQCVMPDTSQSPIVPTHDVATLLQLQPEYPAVRGGHDDVCLTASEGNRALSVMIPGEDCVSEQVALFAKMLLTSREQKKPVRRMPVGSEPQPDGGVDFRVWAPQCREVAVEFEGASADAASMQPEPDGYFSLMVP